MLMYPQKIQVIYKFITYQIKESIQAGFMLFVYTRSSVLPHWHWNNLMIFITTNVLEPQCVNSLWPNDAIWQYKSVSTLAQVMACCLTAPSHYLCQCWLLISDLCGIHLRAISQRVAKLLCCIMCLKIILLTLLLYLPWPTFTNMVQL